MVVQHQLFTAHEFWQLEFDDDRIYELIDGEIVPMPPPRKINSIIAGLILTALNVFLKQNNVAGYVLGADGGYTLTKNDVRVPDVSYIAQESIPDLDNTAEIIPPELAVEIISPSESPRQINAKTSLYLNAGTKIVWNVYPDEKVVEVWTLGEAGKLVMQPFEIGDTLDGGDVLPEFTLSVNEVFAVQSN